MSATTIPERFPATSNDLATSIVRTFGQHMELGIRLTFDGRMDVGVLERAVRLLLDAEPVLGCGLKTSTMRGWWQRRDDLDAHVPFAVVPTDGADSDAVRCQVAPVPDEGPQLFVTLLRSPDHDDVVIDVSHNVADGQSVKHCAYVLADLYTHLLSDPAYVPVPNLARRPEARDVWNVLSEDQCRAARREPRPTMPNWDLPRTGSSGQGRTLRELCLGPGRLAAIAKHGREHGATVNDMMLTAFFRALSTVCPPPEAKPMSLSFSAEHRRYLAGDREPPVSNLAVTIWLAIENRTGEGFDATMERMVAQTTRWRETLWGIRGAVGAAGMAKMGYRPMRLVLAAIGRLAARSGTTSPVFTNIGIIDDERLSFGGAAPVAARISGPAAFGASFVPTISTYRDVLTVSMGFCDRDMDAALVERVLSEMDEQLLFV
jgi:NRPS condensation-like uncharacterized protein